MPQSSPPLFSVRRSASILALALIAALGLFSSEVWAQSAVEEKPSNLTAQVVAAGIQLNWNAPQARAAEVDGYQILRRRPDEGEALLLVLVADTGSTATSYLDATATEPGVSYIYRVKARRGHEPSRFANKVQLTYTAPAPEPQPTLQPEPAPAGVTVELGDITDLQRPQFLVANWTAGRRRSTATASRSASRRSWAWACANRRPTPTWSWSTRRAPSCARRARRARPTNGSR